MALSSAQHVLATLHDYHCKMLATHTQFCAVLRRLDVPHVSSVCLMTVY